MNWTSMLTKKHLQLISIVFLTITVFAFSLEVPFYLDDFRNIKENPLLVTGSLNDFLWQNRFIGTLTFFFQYQLDIASLQAFHIVNIVIHLINVIVIYFLTHEISQKLDLDTNWLPVFTAALFAIHPLNSQPVIYIVQRYTLLAAMFYLSATLIYFHLRDALQNNQSKYFIILSITLISLIILGWFSKQNMASIFFVMFITELIFYQKNINYKKFSAHFSIALISLFALAFVMRDSELMSLIDLASRETNDITRTEYFLAQLNILWIYIGKFYWPTNLRLEYSLHSESFSLFITVISALAHIGLLAIALILLKKRPVITFSILFYYTSHLVESSIIPIRDFAFEHRTYIPNFALSLATSYLLLKVFTLKSKHNFVMPATMILIISTLSIMSVYRVQLWGDKLAFLENERIHSPNNIRVLTSLAKAHRDRGNQPISNQLIELAFNLSGSDIRADVAANYIAMLVETNQVTKANAVVSRVLPTIKDWPSKSLILHNLAVLNHQNKLLDKSTLLLEQVLKSPAPIPDSYYLMSIIALQQKKMARAEYYSKELITKYPNYQKGIQLFKSINLAKTKFKE